MPRRRVKSTQSNTESEKKSKRAKRHILAVHVSQTAKKKMHSEDDRSAEVRGVKEHIHKQEISGPQKSQARVFSAEPLSEKKKSLIMWSGVVFFMALVLVLWGINIRQEFKKVSAANNVDQSSTDWQKMTQDLTSKLDEMKKNLDTISNYSATAANNASSTVASSTNGVQPTASLPQASSTKEISTPAATSSAQAELGKLKTKLEKLNK